MDQARMATALFENLGDPCFFAEPLAFQILDFQASLTGQPEGIVAHLIPQRFGEDPQIKAADVPMTQLSRHRVGMPHIDEHPSEDEAVVAAEGPLDVLGVAVQQF